jgi:hypothetical protein
VSGSFTDPAQGVVPGDSYLSERDDTMQSGNQHISFLGNIQETDVYDPVTGKRAKNGYIREIAM